MNAALGGNLQICLLLTAHCPDCIYERDEDCDQMCLIHEYVQNVKQEHFKPQILELLCGKYDTDSQIDAKLLNSYSSSGTPLHIAVSRGCIPVIETLLAMGADINAFSLSQKGPALLQNGDPKIIKLLLDHGADLNVEDQDGNTVFTKFMITPESLPFFLSLTDAADPAIVCQKSNAASNLIGSAGLFLGENKENCAAFYKAIDRLAAMGCDVCLLKQALPFGNIPLMKKLAEYPHEKQQGLMIQAMMCNAGTDMIDFLLETNLADINEEDEDGGNCLFLPRIAREKFKHLIDKGIDITKKDGMGRNLLWEVLQEEPPYWMPDLLKYLIERRLCPECDASMFSLFEYSIDNRADQFFQYLVEHFDTNKSPGFRTIIFNLIQWFFSLQENTGPIEEKVRRFEELLDLSLRHGADIYAVCPPQWSDMEDASVMQFAAVKGWNNPSTVEILNILQLRLRKTDHPYEKDSKGATVLSRFCWYAPERNGWKESGMKLFHFILDQNPGAVFDQNCYGLLPQHYAAATVNQSTCKELILRNPQALLVRVNIDRVSCIPVQLLIQQMKIKNQPTSVREQDDLIRLFVDSAEAHQPGSMNPLKSSLLQQYLELENSTVEGMTYLLEKGFRCRDLNVFAEKNVAFLKRAADFYTGGIRKIVQKIQQQNGSETGMFNNDFIMCVINAGNVDMMKYLIDNGFQFNEYLGRNFESVIFIGRVKCFAAALVNQPTNNMLKLFFQDWQWSISFIPKQMNGIPFYQICLGSFDSCQPNQMLKFLMFLLDDLHAQISPQKLLDIIVEKTLQYDNYRIFRYLNRKGASLHFSEKVIVNILRFADEQEFFMDTLDSLMESTGGQNILLPYDKDKKTTLLHLAAMNENSIFALRYLIEKYGLSPYEKDTDGKSVFDLGSERSNNYLCRWEKRAKKQVSDGH